MLIGYARVSTVDQNLDLQKNALIRAECELIFDDKSSGKNTKRPGLKKALKRLKKGDTLVVWKLDRLGRRMWDLIKLVGELQEKGIYFRSLTDSFDTGTPAGRFVFHVMGALAEMERELNIERTRAGLAAARERGRIGGRRKIMTRTIVNRAEEMLVAGATRQQVADVIGVGVKTIYKYFPAQYRQPN
ncbi:TPA: recombinase family protein [Raoultella ornithinolytica]|nr:recombinase family protein [Raoultella ornithinolytica]HDT5911554.1 recombinase family protein [Raoultella ornithinolytica]HDT5917390.1 recombinase family protein [Raoultella ornithinolytica]HDT5968348.1 recombinase family protein [Raoultella ornithinolytica]HDT6012555.1 recombinase family protein [Raoultella ornithinolytica]